MGERCSPRVSALSSAAASVSEASKKVNALPAEPGDALGPSELATREAAGPAAAVARRGAMTTGVIRAVEAALLLSGAAS